jgi:hypothetical protein
MTIEIDDALSNLALAAACLTDEQLVGAIRKTRSDDPLVEELASRFADYVAAIDADEAAWLERPQPVSIDASPRPVA